MTSLELRELLFKTYDYLRGNGLAGRYDIELSLDRETLQNIKNDSCAIIPTHEHINTFCGVTFTVEDNFALKIVKKEELKLKDVERPFEDCQELIKTYCERLRNADGFDVISTVMQPPVIWVKLKVDGRKRMIVGYGDGFVEVGVKAEPVTLEYLYKSYTFLDGSICGVKEASYE